MGFLSTIKKVGRAIDPTSSTAPLGGLVRTGIDSVAGQGTAATLNKAANPGNAAPKPAPAPPGSPVPPGVVNALTSKLGISTGLLLAAGLVVLLLVMRRK